MSAWCISRSFLGSTVSITEARRFVTTFLKGWPDVATAELIVSELATNAIRHSASGRFGGRFLVTIRGNGHRVWIGVLDEGGPGRPRIFPEYPELEGGRGLRIVSEMATDWGVQGDHRGRTVWASLHEAPHPQRRDC
ncbi:ATP-binding protein [Nonomuraea phyllanthi]|uniref:ATP-binding protein n=1 Tax=Nonomuraea phyllanthi TaxID=2219224 RepID=UPI00129319F7|nr:ATP-binding protein [Nonomuraea phyllanthi]QFY05348.1 ATP-binding protein [Nonomuraea phyllanthi]